MDEKLIELVRNFPELYDLSHKKYMDIGFKNDIWNEIGKELKIEGSSCKTRWNNIRDNYRKSIKKTKTKSGQASKKIKLYKYAEQLGFLRQFFDERDTKGNIEFQDESEEKENNGEQDNEEQNTVHDEDTPTFPVQTESDLSQSSFHRNLQNRIQQTPKMTKKRTAPQQSASSQLMEYLIKKKSEQPATPTSTITHPVDAFLAGIGATLKTLPPYYLNLAKTEIFNIVQNYEMQMITAHTHTSGHHSLHDEHQSGSSATSHVSVYTNLTSPCDMTQTPIASPDPVVDQQHPIVHDLSSSAASSRPLQTFFETYKNV